MTDPARQFPGLEIERFEPSCDRHGELVDDRFECSRCHRLVPVHDGGCPDEFDIDGDMCSACWCEVAKNHAFRSWAYG